MIGRTNIPNTQNAQPTQTDSNQEFNRLKESLIVNYPFSEEILSSIPDLSFEMSYNQISAQKLLDEIEALIWTEGQDKVVDTKQLREFLVKSMAKLVNTNKDKAKKKTTMPVKINITKENPINNNKPDGMIIDNNNLPIENRELKFENYSTYNEKNLPNARVLNSHEINYTFFSNLEIKEYDLVPKDDDSYYEEYIKYFDEYKKNFLKALQIESDNSLLEVDKFVLLVTFDNFEGRPILSDIVLVNPLKNFQRYTLKIENENITRDYYFFNGQIIFIEGHIKNNEIYAQKILFGIAPVTYNLNDSYVRGFFQESNPYITYALNGPILNKTNVDMGIFLQTLNHIAKDNPHALIINGPILNLDNAMIQSGDIKMTNNENIMNYFELFESVLVDIGKIFNDKRTTIILSPSLGDITSFYPLPQPPFNFSYLKNINNLDIIKKGKLKLIGNPQIFQLNEIILGVANFEVVKDMISNSLRSNNKTPLDSSLEMILQQRNFYPILPNSVNSDEIDKMDKIITIDERKLLDMYIGFVPDVIITPMSTMNPYIKKVSSTLFINPGNLIKNGNPGSFIKITSYPPDVNFTLLT